MTLDDLPRLLRDARFMRDCRLREAARQIGVSPATLSRIERGDSSPDLAKVRKVVRWLNLEIALQPKRKP